MKIALLRPLTINKEIYSVEHLQRQQFSFTKTNDTRVHSGDQMPPPRGHFTGTQMKEGRQKTKTEKHC